MPSFEEQLTTFREGFASNTNRKTVKVKGMIRASHRAAETLKVLDLDNSPPIICAYIGTKGDPNQTFHAIHFPYDKSNVVHFMPKEASNMNKDVEFLVYEDALFVGRNKNGKFFSDNFINFNEQKVINQDAVTTSPQTASHKISIGVG